MLADAAAERTIFEPIAWYFAGSGGHDDGMWPFHHYSQVLPSVFQHRRWDYKPSQKHFFF
jgi:hypothetical protein